MKFNSDEMCEASMLILSKLHLCWLINFTLVCCMTQVMLFGDSDEVTDVGKCAELGRRDLMNFPV